MNLQKQDRVNTACLPPILDIWSTKNFGTSYFETFDEEETKKFSKRNKNL